MSYRDLRNFSETMRALGFPDQISLESFRSPNWTLVEACTRWLVARVEPDAVLAGGAHTMEQRVAMVTHATELQFEQDNRNRALSRQLDLSSLESALTRSVESLSSRVAAMREQTENVEAGETALDAKLERRRAELFGFWCQLVHDVYRRWLVAFVVGRTARDARRPL